MKKLLAALTLCTFLSVSACNADTTASLVTKADVQRVENIGMNLLISNNISHKFTFQLGEFAKQGMMPIVYDTELVADYDLHNNRNVRLYVLDYDKLTSNDEIAGLLAHEIAQGEHSYTGVLNGQFMFTKNGPCPFNYIAKQNELNFDKKAVDYMVKAGYNPIAIITAYSKTLPEWRGTFWGRHNATQKRMNNVYSYIKTKYPSYLLEENEFTSSVYYRRFSPSI